MQTLDKSHETFRARIDPAGRVLIPATTRHRLGIDQGDELIVEVDDRGIHITTAQQAVKEVQAFFSDIKPTSGLLSEELIRDRREEAERESRG
ncbi:AbrB/MazE/SpoVT family DNA-binding domain-containing protein [Singulisphaera acidiphila]|nr:AbrB/MazE/SpoVT family DNA-binding domain-containing protein [Singulisphaera acidiphila]